MDLTLVLSAVIFTLLAVVVATSLLSADSSGPPRRLPGSERAEPRLNGHVPERRKKKEEEEEKKKEEEEGEDWCEISGSSHDHWDVVKSVLSEEAHPHLHTEGVAAPVEPSSSTPVSLEVDPPSRASSGRGRRSFIGLSEKELLKCAFSYPQTEGATESPDIDDKADSLKYVPGKARSHHLQMMMSKEELEEEQRVQREQLAAIFQLLRDNKETFGEVSEGDMEEQLRLYSI